MSFLFIMLQVNLVFISFISMMTGIYKHDKAMLEKKYIFGSEEKYMKYEKESEKYLEVCVITIFLALISLIFYTLYKM